jgi:hypothetical protein
LDTVDLDKRRNKLKTWTPHHRALLNALRAEPLVPKLISRLSLERCTSSSADLRLLRDWAASLQKDPGWKVIKAHLDRPDAWPEAWHRGVDAGWSARTDHHHALLFGRFCDELVAHQDMEVARYVWGECVDAWIRIFDSDYADTLLSQLTPTTDSATSDSPQSPTIWRNLLAPLAQARERDLCEALGLDQPRPNEHFDRRRTRFGWRALELIAQRVDLRVDQAGADGVHVALAGLREHAKDAFARIRSELLTRFSAMVDAVDLSDDAIETVSLPFEWIRQVFTILPIDATVAARVSDATVTIGWTLRKLEIDQSDALVTHILGLASPFNDKLADCIDSGEAFGHNATCADFFVFQGEHRDATAKREFFFDRARQVCPGHRNASMMLSYEKLREVSDLMMRIRLTPAALRIVPGAPERVEAAIRDVSALLDDAHELYPANETISNYRQEVVAEAERLGTPLDETTGE